MKSQDILRFSSHEEQNIKMHLKYVYKITSNYTRRSENIQKDNLKQRVLNYVEIARTNEKLG